MIGKRLIKNTGFVFVSGGVDKLLSALFIAYAARVLGPKDFGLYALIGTIAFLFFYFGNFGIGPMGVREIAKNKIKAEELFNHILSLRVCLVIVAYPATVLAVNLLGYKSEVKNLIYIAGLSAIFSTFSSSFKILYVAFERFKIPSLISILVSFFSNISYIIILHLGYGLKGIIWISFLGSFLGALITGIWIRKRFIKYRFTYNLPVWKDLMLQSLPFALLTFFRQANKHMNILLLSKLPGPLPGDVAMGYYNPPASACRMALVFPESFRQAALPAVSANAGDLNAVKRIIDGSTKSLLAFVIFPLILATTFFSKEIITIVFGKEYLLSSAALTVLGWAYALQVFNAPVNVTLSTSREMKKFIPWAMVIIGVNLVLAVPLIIYYSFLGAAIAFLISKIFETFVRNYLLWSLLGIKGLETRKLFKALAPMTAVFFILLLVYLRQVNPWLLFVLTAALYSGCIFLMKELREGIVAVIKGIRRKLLNRVGIHGKE